MMARHLTAEGVRAFREYLGALRREPASVPPWHLLTDAGASASGPDIELEQRSFSSRLDLATFLNDRLASHSQWGGGLLHHQGFWAWLSLYYFDACCPPTADGGRRPKEDGKYIPPEPTAEEAFRKYYRHLLAGPYTLFRNHGAMARLFLVGPVHEHPDTAEQVASRLDFVTNNEICKLVDSLYFDPKRHEMKRGATNYKRPGTLRRLIRVLQQLDLTYDLYALSAVELRSLLPAEFARFD